MHIKDKIKSEWAGINEICFEESFLDEAIIGFCPFQDRVAYSFFKAVSILSNTMDEEKAIIYCLQNLLNQSLKNTIWVMDYPFLKAKINHK